MTRLRGLLVCLVLVGMGGPATACLNDEESPAHEREFRSQYGGLVRLHSHDEFADQHRDRNSLLIGGGAALLVGGFTLAAKRARSRA